MLTPSHVFSSMLGQLLLLSTRLSWKTTCEKKDPTLCCTAGPPGFQIKSWVSVLVIQNAMYKLQAIAANQLYLKRAMALEGSWITKKVLRPPRSFEVVPWAIALLFVNGPKAHIRLFIDDINIGLSWVMSPVFTGLSNVASKVAINFPSTCLLITTLVLISAVSLTESRGGSWYPDAYLSLQINLSTAELLEKTY